MNTEQTTLAIVELKKSKEMEAYYNERAQGEKNANNKIADYYYRKLAEQKMFTEAIETIMEIYEAE